MSVSPTSLHPKRCRIPVEFHQNCLGVWIPLIFHVHIIQSLYNRLFFGRLIVLAKIGHQVGICTYVKRWCEAYRASGSSCTCGTCGTFTFATGGTRGGCFRWELVHPEVSPHLIPFCLSKLRVWKGCSKKEGANIDTKKLSRSSSGKQYIYILYTV